jgi:alkylhydroperoxidase/carboxymuconolactone decarboxylase family protein YurZ
MEKTILEEKTENLIAIGAATAANCIPCFEHLYEKAITSGITMEEINRTTKIAGQVKKGAHNALTKSIDELIGVEKTQELPCIQAADSSCCD